MTWRGPRWSLTRGGLGVPPARNSVKAADRVVEYFRAAIATGKFALGERLPTERDIAKEFGLSQPTVREAVRGLLALSQGCTCFAHRGSASGRTVSPAGGCLHRAAPSTRRRW